MAADTSSLCHRQTLSIVSREVLITSGSLAPPTAAALCWALNFISASGEHSVSLDVGSYSEYLSSRSRP